MPRLRGSADLLEDRRKRALALGRAGQSSPIIVSPRRQTEGSQFRPFPIQIVLAPTMRYRPYLRERTGSTPSASLAVLSRWGLLFSSGNKQIGAVFLPPAGGFSDSPHRS